jgi:hypothetical protein
MASCIRCKLTINDDSMMCPLCNGVLVRDEEEYLEAEKNERGIYISRSITYPSVAPALRRTQLLIKIAIFAAVLAEVVSVIINYYTYNGVWWSLIVGLVLAYGCFILVYSFSTHRSLQKIIHVQSLVAILLMVAMDFILGHRGWAIRYAIPITLMAISTCVVVLMIINVENWQSYIITEIVVTGVGAILLILQIVGVITSTILLLISVLISGTILSGTILFGSRIVSDEIKRRFMV